MPKFVVLIQGVNALIRDLAATEPALRGFYVNACLETATAGEAEARAVELVRTSPKLQASVANSSANPPRLSVEEITEVADWPNNCSLPLNGFIFYDDPGAQ